MDRVVKPPHGSMCDAYLPGCTSVRRCGNKATHVVRQDAFPNEVFLCDECALAILRTVPAPKKRNTKRRK